MYNEDKLIEKCKKFNYNFFWTNSKFWGVLIFVLGLTPFYELLKFFISSDIFLVLFLSICLIIAVVGYFIYDSIKKKPIIEPLKKSRHFVGIYNIDDLNKNKEYYNDVLISRVNEVEYLKELLDKIFQKDSEIHSISIIGQSGTGKSTIINCLLNELIDVNIINCTDRYKDLDTFVLKKLKKETWEEFYEQLQNCSQKTFFIFDQFERFFYLDYYEQLHLRKLIFDKLNFENVASIFVLRKDYFADFMYNINTESYIIPKGTLSSLDLKNLNSNKYLIYCKNTTDEDFLENLNNHQEKIIQNRNDEIKNLCLNSFDRIGEQVYNRFQYKKLIEKQIFLNLLENKYDTTDFVEYFEKNNDRDLIIQYYDKQLSSTGNYYISAKIMYLLSAGRIHNLLYSKQQIYEALLISKDLDIQNINIILEKLYDLQLIKLVQRQNINYFEIVHDYIAESFLEYAEVNLHEYAKSTLDDYRVNHKNVEYLEGVKKCLKSKKCKKTFELTILIFVINIITINSFYQLLYLENNYNLFVNLPLYLASYYGYCLFTNIFKLYTGKNKWIMYLLYLGMALCVIGGSVKYKIWLTFAGIGTMLIGINFCIIRNNDKISRVAKKFYSDFFNKVTWTGFVIFIAGSIFSYININIYIGILLICAELIYAYIAQLSEEYYDYCVGLMNSK